MHHDVELVDPSGATQRLTVGADELIWEASLRQGIELPATCLQGWCLTCAGRVLEGHFDQSGSQRYYSEDRRAGFILLCTARPRSGLRIVTHQKAAMQQHRRAHGLPTTRG